MSVMRGYSVEHILGALLELRDYRLLEKRVSFLIMSRGWSHIVWALRKSREAEAIVPDWNIGLREGILRDSLIHLLRLEDFAGLDVDFLEEFATIESDYLNDLRKEVHERAIELLCKQTRKRNTFFMDIERMKMNNLVVFIPDILDARIREVEALDSDPALHEVYSTYYGFQILTTKVDSMSAGIPSEVHEHLQSVLTELSGVKELHPRQLKFSPLSFQNCSPHLKTLLWNMLRLSHGGMKAKLKALEVLGDLGDSRVIDLLHSYVDDHRNALRTTKEHQLLEQCMLCLGRIGSPQSYDFLSEFTTDVGEIAFAGIRHPHVRPWFKRKVEETYGHSQRKLVNLVQALGKTRSREWLIFYELLRELYSSSNLLEEIRIAEQNIHPPFEFG